MQRIAFRRIYPRPSVNAIAMPQRNAAISAKHCLEPSKSRFERRELAALFSRENVYNVVHFFTSFSFCAFGAKLRI